MASVSHLIAAMVEWNPSDDLFDRTCKIQKLSEMAFVELIEARRDVTQVPRGRRFSYLERTGSAKGCLSRESTNTIVQLRIMPGS